MDNIDFNLEAIIVKGLDVSPDCFGVMYGEDNLIIYCNQTFAQLFGSTKEKVIGSTNDQLLRQSWETKCGIRIVTEDFDLWLKKVNKLHKTKEINQFETDLTDGRWFRMTRMNLDKNFKIYLGVNITELKELQYKLEQANQHIEHLANTDSLTNISNRRFFETVSENEFHRAKRYNSHFSLLLLDIDNFKAINDEYGHEAGDDILKELASTCKTLIRKSDTICRIGGEEFVVLLPETGLAKAEAIAEHIRLSIDERIFTINSTQKKVVLSVSIGVSALNDKDQSIKDVIARADSALYKAKSEGRNRVIMLE